MKIAFILSSKNIIPPPKTGGVEYSVYYLARELARRGHDITLYAAPGSKIDGVRTKAMAPVPTSTVQKYANLEERITAFCDLTFLSEFFYRGEWKQYDLAHYNNYIFYEVLPFASCAGIPVIARINYPHQYLAPHIKRYIHKFKNVHFLPTSHFIKRAMPGIPYLDPVYPTIDFDDFPLSRERGEYLLSIGRICPDKGTHLAIRVARQAKKKLVIAGPVSETHRPYFNREIKPHVDKDNIIYVGEVDFETKVKIYQKALATLFPVQWDEPLGIVMIESMSCGTPVIAFDLAAAGEVITSGENGFIVKSRDVSDMADAINEVPGLNREKIRQAAQEKFSIKKQAKKYEDICAKLLRSGS